MPEQILQSRRVVTPEGTRPAAVVVWNPKATLEVEATHLRGRKIFEKCRPLGKPEGRLLLNLDRRLASSPTAGRVG